MFDLSDRPLVWLPIKWTVVRPGEGEDALAVEVEAAVEVEVELKTRDELLAMFEEKFSDEEGVESAEVGGERLKGRELEAKRFETVVKRWRKVVDGGKPLELNKDNIRRMLGVPGFASAFETAYLAACAGKVDIRRGN